MLKPRFQLPRIPLRDPRYPTKLLFLLLAVLLTLTCFLTYTAAADLRFLLSRDTKDEAASNGPGVPYYITYLSTLSLLTTLTTLALTLFYLLRPTLPPLLLLAFLAILTPAWLVMVVRLKVLLEERRYMLDFVCQEGGGGFRPRSAWDGKEGLRVLTCVHPVWQWRGTLGVLAVLGVLAGVAGWAGWGEWKVRGWRAVKGGEVEEGLLEEDEVVERLGEVEGARRW